MKANHFIVLFAAAALAINAGAQQSVGAGFDAGIHYARFFNDWAGLGLGVQYSWANAYTKYNWDEVTTGLTHPSNPYIPYNLTSGFKDFKERQNIGVISIPVEALFRKAFNDRVALIGGVGLSLDIPLHGAYYAKGGSYSTTGVFPEAGSYVLSNMPEHGFSTYDNVQGAKINNRAKVGGSVIADLGARIALNDNWGLYIGVNFAYGFSNLLAEEKTAEMIMINAENPAIIDYRGTFDCNETGKVNLLRCGLKIAIDFGWPAVNKKAEAERIALEEAERLAAEKAAAEQAEAERLAREEAERQAAERAAREEAERLAAEKAAAEKAAAEEAARQAEFKRRVEAVTVHFDIAGAKLNIPEAEKEVVDELCEVMKSDKSFKIVITGHTDCYGDPEQNLRYFGMKRAEALKSYMVGQGVAEDQIRCDSKGDKEPIAPNDTRANRALNRRANIRIE